MKKPVVLSIEDDEGLFQLIALTLRRLPLELHNVPNGRQAVEKVLELQPALIILDISLPDLHGWEVLDRLKELNSRPKHIIVLTTYATATHRVIGRLQDVTAYLTKPFDREELAGLVAETLELK
jgi:two-component system, OmpR family, response regulator MprA